MLDYFSELGRLGAYKNLPGVPAIADAVLDSHSHREAMAKKNGRVQVLHYGKQVDSISTAEAINRISSGAYSPLHKKRRLVAVVKLYRDTAHFHRQTSSVNLIGQKFTHRLETITNPPRCFTLKRFDDRTLTFRND